MNSRDIHFCYIDESGDLGPLPPSPSPNSNDQPVFVLCGLFVNASSLATLTNDFLNLKHHYFPGLAYPSPKLLDRIIPEVKGADLRRYLLRGNRNQRRNADRFVDKIVNLLETNDIRLVSRIWVKPAGGPFDATAIYTSSVQAVFCYFDRFLADCDGWGLCIADSRSKHKNVRVSHSIFTQKFQTCPLHDRVLELPTFGHSDNHAGLQICDLICSALLFPIACEAYCSGTVSNVHVQPAAARLKADYGTRLKNLQFRYVESTTGRYTGGIVVSDPGRRPGSFMFK
jgi:hypothetical protein